MSYKMDMKNEQEKKKLLPEGWRKFQITECIEKVSKAGNEMFVITFRDIETLQPEEVFAIATAGKRWFLKSILNACGVSAAADGVYEWDITDILDQMVNCRIQHFDETWINREGETVISKKAKIVEVERILQEQPLNKITHESLAKSGQESFKDVAEKVKESAAADSNTDDQDVPF